MKYQIIDATRTVINTIIWDGVEEYTPPDGCVVVQSDVAGIGWTYSNGQFIAPPQPEPDADQPVSA